jgi:hypothetical protein
MSQKESKIKMESNVLGIIQEESLVNQEQPLECWLEKLPSN